MTALLDLIQKMKEATGPDRELDIAIAIETFIGHDDGAYGKQYARGCLLADPYPGRFEVVEFSGVSTRSALEYTKSIDAALTLCAIVHPDYFWCIETTFGTPRATFAGRVIDAPTPALALCIAALEARQKMKEAV